MSIMAAALLASCSDEGGEMVPERRLSLSLGARQFLAAEDGKTRALPDGFVLYKTMYPDMQSDDDKILAFITPKNGSAVMSRLCRWTSDENNWQANVSVDDISDPYYIYGFMPVSSNTSDNISVARLPESGGGYKSYAKGAVITVRNLNAVTDKDPCVIVGVKKPAGGTTSIEDSGIVPGQFEYEFSEITESSANNDFVYLLFDHIYMGLEIKIKVDAGYAELRKIRLKSMTLEMPSASTVNAVVTLEANGDEQSPISSVTYTTSATGGDAAVSLSLKHETDGKDFLLETDYKDISACFCPASDDGFRLTTTYDVYDRSDNLIRAGETAVNSFSLSNLQSADFKAGTRHILRLNVQPTYLYMLSDPDLDNPTINIEH